MQPTAKHIVVIGSGPAGVASAIGLMQLGYRVTCISKPRRPGTIEGLSERAYQALVQLGLQQALESISEPLARAVMWNGVLSAANTERLIDRLNFDLALIEDLKRLGVDVIEDSVATLTPGSGGWRVTLGSGGVVAADFLVDARGRRSSNSQKALSRGPESVSLGQFWELPSTSNLAPGVMVINLPSGWAWLTCDPDRRVYTQLSMSARSDALPPKGSEPTWIKESLAGVATEFEVIQESVPTGPATFRGCTPILQTGMVADTFIRVGDAAMAVDPLSGNGIFQALSSALTAPAVINTILSAPKSAELAKGFYQERLNHLFFRFSRVGRDFYREVESADQDDFWSGRQKWPDDQPAHYDRDKVLGIETRPVINNGLIELQEVVITDNQPLGIWMVDGERAVDRLARLQRR